MRIRAILALLALCVLAQARAAVTLHVAVVQHVEQGKPEDKAPADRSQQLDVTLADSYIQVDTGAGRMIYDFKTRRRYAIDTAARRYVEYSLFDTLGFRVLEMNHRERAHAALLAAHTVDTPLPAVQLENELAILKSAPSAVSEKTVDGMRELSVGGARLAAWSRDGASLSADDAARFAQFLRYTQGGHPQLLDMLAKGGLAPQRLTFFIDNGFGTRRTVSLTVTDVRPAQPPAYDLQPYRRDVAASGIDSLFDRIDALTPQQLDALRATHPCDAATDFGSAAVLDTMLGRLECTLSAGTPLSLTAEEKQAVSASPAMSLLFAAINPAKPEEYANAVKTLTALRQQAPRKAYVLMVFEANNRTRMRQLKEAAQLFTQALQANPLLAGAYKDLGDLLLMQYDSRRAWRSWDAGRRIAPGLANFAPINKFEAELAAQHPEYF